MLNKLYEKMYAQILKDNEALTDKLMRKAHSETKKALNKTINKISNVFVEYATDGKLVLTQAQKVSIRNMLDKELKSMGRNLAEKEVSVVAELLEEIAKESFYKTAYVLDYGTKTKVSFDLIRKEFIDSIVNMNYKGEMFSDRIWTNKDKLIKRLKMEIEDAMKGNKTVEQVARGIRKDFNITVSESQRLARSEMARCQVMAQEEIGRSAGVKKVMWLATLDDKTADEDADLDGQTWDIDEDHPRPVFDTHPNCRCCLINVPSEDWQPTQRKDNETKEVIDYKDYNSWLNDRDID